MHMCSEFHWSRAAVQLDSRGAIKSHVLLLYSTAEIAPKSQSVMHLSIQIVPQCVGRSPVHLLWNIAVSRR